MIILERPFPGAALMMSQTHRDERGSFARLFDRTLFENEGWDTVLDHSAESFNPLAHTLRGLHFQSPPYEEQKLVRCISGSIFDVAVDLRKSSPTFGQYVSQVLSVENKKQLWIPEGFAHGFLTLSDTSEFLYKTTDFYDKVSERTILWNDKTLNIDWGYLANLQLSEKDLSGLSFQSSEFFS